MSKNLRYITFTWSGPASVGADACPTGDLEVAGSTPAEVGNILSWRSIMKYFLRSFSPFADSKRAAKVCPLNVWLGKVTVLDMTSLG